MIIDPTIRPTFKLARKPKPHLPIISFLQMWTLIAHQTMWLDSTTSTTHQNLITSATLDARLITCMAGARRWPQILDDNFHDLLNATPAHSTFIETCKGDSNIQQQCWQHLTTMLATCSTTTIGDTESSIRGDQQYSNFLLKPWFA